MSFENNNINNALFNRVNNQSSTFKTPPPAARGI